MAATQDNRTESEGLGLRPADLTRQRDEAAAQLVRALLIINAGGAGALLLFLQAIWVASRELAKPIVIALIILSFGAVAAAAFHLFRHQASLRHQSGDTQAREKFDRLYLTSASVSLLAFIRRKDTKAVQVLLLRGARLDIPDATGMTALAYAQALGHAPILELLQNNANRLQPNA